MSQVITFEDFTPVARYDALPWTEALIDEASTETGTWAQIDTLTLSPVDSDPANPTARNLTTELASDTADLWYRIRFRDATGDTSLPTAAVQNTVPSTIDADPYATVAELARILKITNPTAAQTAAMERVLASAAGEINSEIGRVNSDLSGWELSLTEEVNLERAVEHWEQGGAPFGLLGFGAVAGPAYTSKDSWERHANKLAPLKTSWGLA